MTQDNQPLRFLEDAARVLLTSFSEVVPPDAQIHLINAQRELVLAVAATVEHNASRSVRKPRATPRAKRAAAKRPSKVTIS